MKENNANDTVKREYEKLYQISKYCYSGNFSCGFILEILIIISPLAYFIFTVTILVIAMRILKILILTNLTITEAFI